MKYEFKLENCKNPMQIEIEKNELRESGNLYFFTVKTNKICLFDDELETIKRHFTQRKFKICTHWIESEFDTHKLILKGGLIKREV